MNGGTSSASLITENRLNHLGQKSTVTASKIPLNHLPIEESSATVHTDGGDYSTSSGTNELGMSHWINDDPVKTETRSPSIDTTVGGGTNSLIPTSNLHIDSASLFGTNVTTQNPLDIQNPNTAPPFDPKSEYYYYNSMQQYPATFYSSYGTPYPTRGPSKISSPNSYLTSGYTGTGNSNPCQLYPTYGYNNFGQFSSAQQDYSSYYNDQYSGYYNTAYSSYSMSSPSSSGNTAAGLHVSAALPDCSTDNIPLASTVTIQPHTSNSPILTNNNSSSAKSTPTSKSGRARGRRHAHPSPTRSTSSDPGTIENIRPPERVFIWDLDETIILFISLLSGQFCTRYKKTPEESAKIQQLALAMEDLIFNMADAHFFYNDIEDCDQVHIDDVSSDDNGQDLSNYNFSADGFHAGVGQGDHPIIYFNFG